ncbi:hypothetical protein Tco_1378988 [Tanacetum coccineum]
MNVDTPVGVAFTVKEDVAPSVVDMMVEMEMLRSFEDTIGLGFFPPLSTSFTTTAGNAPGKSSYANVTGKPSGKKLNIRTLFTLGGNRIDVVVLVESIRAIRTLELLKEDVSTVPLLVKLHGVPVTVFSEDGLSTITTKLANVELKDNIVVAMPKITREGHYICNVRVEYEWKLPRCASCKVFGHIHEECPKNTCAGEKKTVKKLSQTSRGVPVGLKMGFKPQKEYRPVLKKHTASSRGTNRGTTNLVNNGATLSGSSFMNIDNNSTGTTHIIDKIRKFEELLTSGQVILVDEAGKPLKKVDFSGDYDSEDEVALVNNDMARYMASERVGFGTQSLLEQWRDSYGNGDYDDDPYDDDMYEGQDLSKELQAICDNQDIRVQGIIDSVIGTVDLGVVDSGIGVDDVVVMTVWMGSTFLINSVILCSYYPSGQEGGS